MKASLVTSPVFYQLQALCKKKIVKLVLAI